MKRIAVILALTAVLGLTACAPAAPSAADQKAACATNQRLILAEENLFHDDSGLWAPIADVVDKMHLKCPSGGTYSFDATAVKVSCSVHGSL